MLNPASSEFLLLAATLIDRLPASPSEPLDEAVLLQLQALFGPMLLSALQSIDRREVVKISLPHGRTVYQVTASTGKPYTLHLDLSDFESAQEMPLPLPRQNSPPPGDDVDMALDRREKEEPEVSVEDIIIRQHQQRLNRTLKSFEGVYCACTGFAYNSLAGDRNYFCKHILAVILAHQMKKEIRTEVTLAGVVDLLGLNEGQRPEDVPP